ncbi:tyrosine-type recombinase/integrase [Corynebacterium glyciniphilum]|uniref:tyrosine-type recombinase/integrase n=1 Tax=Corynebacterium glyciniphilum TaxID=1404244 RepID=UPI0011AB795B|nr:site-specific integrase [Corynebacterium glyciniphilum]
MPRRRPPEGPAPKGKKVRWEASYYDAAGNRHYKTFYREKDAKAFEDDQRVDVRSGKWVDPKDMATPFIDIAREWLNEATKENTIANRKALIDNLGDLGGMPVGTIKASNITAWRNVLLEGRPWKKNKPLSESTVGNMVGQVCGLLKRAHNDGMIGRVPVVKIPKTAPMTSPTRQDLLTVEEVAEMITAMRDGHRAPRGKNGKRKPGAKDYPPRPDISRMIEVVAGAGLRVSEVCGLRVCDVDTMRLTITVNGQVKPGGREWLPVPKSEKSQRDIPVPQGVIDVIVQQLQESPQRDRTGPVFPYTGDARGEEERLWHDRADMGNYMRRLHDVHGFREVGMHDFRHFYASALIAGGATVAEVQDALGHAKPTTTLETYTHLWPKRDSKLRDAAGVLFDLVAAERRQGASAPQPTGDGIKAL